jgi:hypothetical protein
MSTVDQRSTELTELRRAIGVLRHRKLRARLLRLIDDLVSEARWDSVEEISASRELAAARAAVAAAEAQAAAAIAERDAIRAELGRTRRERDAAVARIRDLRAMARNGLGDELVEVCVRVETEHPTNPPLLALRQAARLVRAVRAA